MASNNKYLLTFSVLFFNSLFFQHVSVAAEQQVPTAAQQQTPQTIIDSDQAIIVADNQASYGPIVKADTLWKIAVAHRPDNSVSNYQVMMALFKLNPNAFLRNDINTLAAGQYLRIPALAQIREIAPYPYPSNSKTAVDTAVNANAKIVDPSTASSIDASIIEAPSLVTTNDSLAIQTSPQVSQELASGQNSASIESQSVSEVVIANQPDLAVEPEVTLVNATNNNSEINTAVDSTSTVDAGVDVTTLANQEFKDSLTAVDDQLSYLQFEVAKTVEKQKQMDTLISEQTRLLADSKEREQRLIAQQAKLNQQQQGSVNYSIAYWLTTAILSVLVIILFILVRRRTVDTSVPPPSKKTDQAPKIKNTDSVANTGATKPVVATAKTAELIAPSKAADIMQQQAAVTEKITTEKPSEDELTTRPKKISKTFDDVQTQPENLHVEDAFSKIISAQNQPEVDELLTDEDLLNKIVPNSFAKKQPVIEDVKLQTEDDELDIDQIIDGMLDEKTKPAKLRSAISANEQERLQSNQQKQVNSTAAAVNEINDYDDVEFDKLLAEISEQTNDIIIANPDKVVDINSKKEKVIEGQSVNADLIGIDTLLEESEEQQKAKSQGADDIYDANKIDVGLDEFPEFKSDIKHVNVDDDKHGVNAKLDLAHVYLEIGDQDNAAVILKNVMKLGNSSQQQQAQTLLYSMK